MAKARWQTRTRAPLASRFAVVGEGVVLPTHDANQSDALARHDLADGEVTWQVGLPHIALDDSFASVRVFADGDTVYLAQGARVAAFAAADGACRWDVALPGEAFTIDHVPRVAGDRVYLLSRAARVIAFDRADGTWAFSTEDHEPAFDVVVRRGVVISRSLERHDVRGHDAATGAPLWQHALSAQTAPTTRLTTSIGFATDDGTYLVVDGERALQSLDVKTGAVRWEEPVVGLASYAFAGAVVIVTDSASVRGIDAASGKVHWRHPTGGLSLVAPLDESGGWLALATSVCTVDAKAGAIREQARRKLHPQDRVLAARDGAVVVTTDGGVARRYRRDGGALHELTIGEVAARPGERAAHGVLQAEIAGGGVVAWNTAHELAFFG